MLREICAQKHAYSRAYLWVGSHDCIIPIIIQGGGCGVERAGPIKFSLHLVVFTPFRDLLPIFEPIDLYPKDTRSNKVDTRIISRYECFRS